MKIFVCIGNGLRADGMPGAMSQAIVDKVMKKMMLPWEFLPVVIFCGGYRNPNGLTEAEAMFRYASDYYPAFIPCFFKEENSYRTHNNAVEALKMIAARPQTTFAEIMVCDHPLHLPRTLLTFQVVNRLYYIKQEFRISGLPSEEVYDAEIPGQPQWQSKEMYWHHELRAMFLYHLFLSPLWARFGLWLLRKIWPNERQ